MRDEGSHRPPVVIATRAGARQLSLSSDNTFAGAILRFTVARRVVARIARPADHAVAMRRANSANALVKLRARALLDERAEDSMNIVQKVGLAPCLCAALVMANGCATSDEGIDENQSEAEVVISAHVLHLTVGGLTSIQSPGTPTQWLTAGDRDYAFLDGSTITLKEWSPDRTNCLMFHHWTGACAGQFTTCTFVMNSDVTTEAVWVPIKGCSIQ